MAFHCVQNPMRFVPLDFPEIVALRAQGCPNKGACPPHVNYARELFCRKWGPYFSCACKSPKSTSSPQSQGGGGGVSKEVDSLDYFTAIPIRPEGKYLGMQTDPPTLAALYGLIKYKNKKDKNKGDQGQGIPLSPPFCPQGTKMKVDFNKGNAVCGSCAPFLNGTEAPLSNSFSCSAPPPMYDLTPPNVQIYMLPPSKEDQPPKLRTKMQRCLQPSRYRDPNTVYRLGFQDFSKNKGMALYRGKLAIDKKRVKPCVPLEDNHKIIPFGQPVCVTGKFMKYQKNRNNPSMDLDFQVIPPPQGIDLGKGIPLQDFQEGEKMFQEAYMKGKMKKNVCDVRACQGQRRA